MNIPWKKDKKTMEEKKSDLVLSLLHKVNSLGTNLVESAPNILILQTVNEIKSICEELSCLLN